MGQNLALNMADHGFRVAVYNRTISKVDDFISGPAQGKSIVGCTSPEEVVKRLKKPRIVMMMVKAGQPVDETIERLLPLLEKGDILVDGGNSYFQDTARRIRRLESEGILFIGTGLSGGEECARYGPSIMPGGSAHAWPHVK
jgi:6-phosphogluconate dehydrogenase